MSKGFILAFAGVAFLGGIGLAFGITKGVTFFVSSSRPEVVILDPSIKFSSIKDKKEEAKGGPEVDLIAQVEDIPIEVEKSYVLKNNSTFPKILSKSFIVADIETGEVIVSKNPNQSLPIASLSKLMTAIIAEEEYNTEDEAVVSARAVSAYGAQGNLKKGEKYKIKDLMYPLLLESSNDAAEVLAEYGGRESFITKMNDKAKAMALVNTNFGDPSGLSKENVSSAFDLFLLSKYINEYRDYIFDITKLKQYKLGKKTWYSNSRFRNDSYYVGGKNGYTDEARKTQIALFELPLEGEDGLRTVAVVLLGSSNTEADARAIVKFLNKNVYYE
jgi:serine-type D-Ala-D-Ala carboxypeptidase (penicillin-binding protein 5/6)